MSSVHIISSVAVVAFILLHASFCTVVKERAAKRAWVDVTPPEEGKENEYKYLALVKYGAGPTEMCSASIPTPWTVMTFCTGNPTKAYAGMLKVDVTDNATGAVQEREVMSVANYSETLNALKICKVADWILNNHVGTVNLNLNGKRGSRMKNCIVLGFRNKKGVTTEGTEIAHVMTVPEIGDTQCGLTPATGLFYSNATEDEKLNELTVGGPAVCDGFLRAISKEFKDKASAAPAGSDCNFYIDIGNYREWIENNMKNTTGGDTPDGGAGGNGRAHSLHSSKYVVLGFLLFTIVIFFQ